MTINIKADGVPDGAYGPFNFNCMLTVKDGAIISCDPVLPEGGIYRLSVGGLTFEHDPAPEPEFEVKASKD